jgi:hypothetical protein
MRPEANAALVAAAACLDLVIGDALCRQVVDLTSRSHEIGFEVAGAACKHHQGASAIVRVGDSRDQVIALHAGQSLRHGRLLDLHSLAELGLSQSVGLIEREQLRELARN